MPLRHFPLVDNASFTTQNTLHLENNILVIYVRKAKIMEHTMGHQCCKIGPVPMKSMFFFMKCCSMVFGGFCFKHCLLYSGFCDTIYGEIYTWRIQWIWVQVGIWQPHKGQMQPIVPKWLGSELRELSMPQFMLHQLGQDTLSYWGWCVELWACRVHWVLTSRWTSREHPVRHPVGMQGAFL